MDHGTEGIRMAEPGLTVGRVARLSGTTVRTLHHYEEIGLLVPIGRSAAGYRLYADSDIDRLARILYYRELGFPLDAIARLLDEPGTEPVFHLQRQRALLRERIDRLDAMVAAIDRETEALMKGYNLTAAEKLEVFGDFDPDQYDDEARERWGESDAWQQSRQRTSRYTTDDWQRIKEEAGSIYDRFVTLMQSGIPAAGIQAMDLAEEHRQHLTRWFYDCGYDIHRGLAEMYIADPRFTASIDAAADGLAAYMRDAILANAEGR
jgi:DNA-binding transcriptional MerR regulator